MSMILGEPKLTAGQNCVVEAQKTLNGDVQIVIRTLQQKHGVNARMPPLTAVAFGLAILEAAGVPINAEMGKRLLAEKMQGAPGLTL